MFWLRKHSQMKTKRKHNRNKIKIDPIRNRNDKKNIYVKGFGGNRADDRKRDRAKEIESVFFSHPSNCRMNRRIKLKKTNALHLHYIGRHVCMNFICFRNANERETNKWGKKLNMDAVRCSY